MVKVAIAGGSGNVAREILEAIVAKNKHDVLVLTRKVELKDLPPGVQSASTNYGDTVALARLLQGVEVVLSFIIPFLDPKNTAQMNLIDACVSAGVRRFAPSEWATASNSGLPVYAGKDAVRLYLESINEQGKVLEYTLFQPGLFLNFFTYPKPSAKHLVITGHYIDFNSKQAILVDDGLQPCTFTVIQDLAAIVAEALDYEGEWSREGGV